jgi:hypothetical protein
MPRAIDPAVVARVFEAKVDVEPQPTSIVERPSTWIEPPKTELKPWRPRWMPWPLRSPTGGKGIAVKIRW